jgi:hypothetical protein
MNNAELQRLYDLGVADWTGPANKTGLARLKGAVRKMSQEHKAPWVLLPMSLMSHRNRNSSVRTYDPPTFLELTAPEKAALSILAHVLEGRHAAALELVGMDRENHVDSLIWYELALMFEGEIDQTTLYRKKDGKPMTVLQNSSPSQLRHAPHYWGADVIKVSYEFWPNSLTLLNTGRHGGA